MPPSRRGPRQNGDVVKKPVHRDPLEEHLAEDDKKGGDRRHQAALIGVAVAAVLLVWFALANLRDVRIDFWVDTRHAPLIVVIVISGLLGALMTWLAMRRRGNATKE